MKSLRLIGLHERNAYTHSFYNFLWTAREHRQSARCLIILPLLAMKFDDIEAR